MCILVLCFITKSSQWTNNLFSFYFSSKHTSRIFTFQMEFYIWSMNNATYSRLTILITIINNDETGDWYLWCLSSSSFSFWDLDSWSNYGTLLGKSFKCEKYDCQTRLNCVNISLYMCTCPSVTVTSKCSDLLDIVILSSRASEAASLWVNYLTTCFQQVAKERSRPPFKLVTAHNWFWNW